MFKASGTILSSNYNPNFSPSSLKMFKYSIASAPISQHSQGWNGGPIGGTSFTICAQMHLFTPYFLRHCPRYYCCKNNKDADPKLKEFLVLIPV